MRLISLLLSALLLLAGPAAPALAATEEAVLAGGCFWCLEHDLEGLPGILDVESGYSGGKLAQPSYRQVSGGGTGHQEVVRVRFDTTKLRYEALLRAYWRNIDPFDGGGQFCDRGSSYKPVIFTTSATQAVEARNSLVAAARELGRPTSSLKVAIRPLSRFWPAEEYHQNYARRNGLKYKYYRWSCGRDRRLDQVWGARARTRDRWIGRGEAPANTNPPAEAPTAAVPTTPAAPTPAAPTPAAAPTPVAQSPAASSPAPASPAAPTPAAPSPAGAATPTSQQRHHRSGSATIALATAPKSVDIVKKPHRMRRSSVAMVTSSGLSTPVNSPYRE